MTKLPLEVQPDSALEGRVLSTLVATGLVRPRRRWPIWVAAAAAVLALAAGLWTFHPASPEASGNRYAVLLYEDSTYVPALPGHEQERVAVVAHWADSLDAVGKFERVARLRGPGQVGGLFIVRADDDADAARIGKSCPFTKWGGHVEVQRIIRRDE